MRHASLLKELEDKFPLFEEQITLLHKKMDTLENLFIPD